MKLTLEAISTRNGNRKMTARLTSITSIVNKLRQELQELYGDQFLIFQFSLLPNLSLCIKLFEQMEAPKHCDRVNTAFEQGAIK